MFRCFQSQKVGLTVGTYEPATHPHAHRPQAPVWPTTAPTVDIYHVSGAVATEVASKTMARQHEKTGWHYYVHKTDRTGVHIVRFGWQSSGIATQEVTAFNVLANAADPAGTLGTSQGSGMVISMYTYERPEVTHVVWETDTGELVARQNPR